MQTEAPRSVEGRPLQSDGRLHGVVVACRRSDGRYLLIRRSSKVSAPLKVCFPGGAIEVGESQPEAVIREMREELGIKVTPDRCIWQWSAENQALTLWGWTAKLLSDRIIPHDGEVAEVLWLTSDEAAEHPDTLPNNRELVACVKAAFDSVLPDQPKA